jgi:trk system potassium uptake protein TrkH
MSASLSLVPDEARRHPLIQALLPVANVLGRLMLLFSLAYVIPIAGSLLFHDGIVIDFVLAMLINAAMGLVLIVLSRRHVRDLKVRDGFLLVTLSWTLVAAIATTPLLIVYQDLSFTDAFFEMMSAMTTTGATVLTGLDHAPRSINLWRHQLQWLGGLGIIVLAVAILPLLGVGGMQLFKAEAPGPMKDTKVTERIGQTARALWLVYVGLTLLCMVSLRLAGMEWFDAVCHAFSALSLGGFSTRDASISAWNSPAIEAVLVVFMLLAGINFATHFLAWRERSLRSYWRDAEARAYAGLVLASCVGIAAFLFAHGTYADFWTALRHSTFNVVSIATTTGYMSVDFAQWPLFAPLWMLLLSGVASCSGSTGGGIKMMRTLILYEQAKRELLRLLHPNLAGLVKLGTMAVPNKVVFAVLGFTFLYFVTAVSATFLLVAGGLDLLTAITAVIACINNTGPGLGSVGPAQNFAGLSDFQTWVLSFTMLLGRLEILTVAVVFTPYFWRQ